jgi:phosphomannomutase/phosphoglucomutase
VRPDRPRLGSEARDADRRTVVVGRDGRLSGPELSQALMPRASAPPASTSSTSAWCPPRSSYFAAHQLGTGSAVMVTGSHNPPDYNGSRWCSAATRCG